MTLNVKGSSRSGIWGSIFGAHNKQPDVDSVMHELRGNLNEWDSADDKRRERLSELNQLLHAAQMNPEESSKMQKQIHDAYRKALEPHDTIKGILEKGLEIEMSLRGRFERVFIGKSHKV